MSAKSPDAEELNTMPQARNSSPARSVVDLNGDWERQVHGKLIDVVRIPSSLRPSGEYTLRRSFLLPRLKADERAFLRFHAVNYYGRVSLNGKELGQTIPYVAQEFDCTQQAAEGRNAVELTVIDAGSGANGEGKNEVLYGTPGGWESYGGIIRDTYVEIRPATFIENVRFGYRFERGYGKAECTVQVWVSSVNAGEADCEVALFLGSSAIAGAKATIQLNNKITTVELQFGVHDVALWSPEEPNLYELRATLKSPAGEDAWSCRTGFREIKIEGRNFLLNGQRLVLNGTCRHDMWKDQGFTLMPEQQEKDMRMIKALGCNFVRLVHYPHDRRIIELADQLGLLVSEEPGVWQVDFSKVDSSFGNLALRVLETTIRRDWNSPAVMAWLLGNESEFTASYLISGKQLCNKLDPIFRPVSVAHINGSVEHAKELFDQTALDFYDWHAYEFSEDKFDKLPQEFGPAKPLTFTEWGWEEGGHGDWFYERNFDGLLEQTETGNVAGHVFWSWNDMRQYTREDWATQNGVLLSGAVTEDREIRQPIYSRLAGLFAGRREIPEYAAPRAPRVLPLRNVPFSPGSSHSVVDLQSLAETAAARQGWYALESRMKAFWSTVDMAENQWARTGGHLRLWQTPVVEIAGVVFRSPVIDGSVRPLLLSPEVAEIVIPIDQPCSKLHILGQVTWPSGYPLQGHREETVAVYSLVGADGRSQDLPVRNGFEVARANRIHAATRVDPIAVQAQPALEFSKDVVREQYQFLLWSVALRPRRIRSLKCKLNGGQYCLAILAITTEQGVA
jgi:glycosyl hydrolase family 2